MYRSDQGCILHFHPSMRRIFSIQSCDVSWISPFEHEREILFARSFVASYRDEKTHKEEYAWNAKVESENEYTQMILLTWVKYDQYIQQTMQISAMWNHQIDLNLIYTILQNNQGKIDQIIAYLSIFKTWKLQPNNIKEYEKRKKEFIERRCCNHQINLFSIFSAEEKNHKYAPIEFATISIIQNGMPFVEKDKNMNK
ncbi:hypothetical protein RFI_38689 [Reticulomyxa filosa]|uniref:Uncharacterized protein n=1 Tax=Reticulomyxa filosa TaxID=46433 RepID=X6LB83_RETFI|nr:hypothetical protein RFI_38689 [Reticulomyxa filosa]|eukprot:ETN98798.1 hypothetical protein RFI_38689 [Reticulomyxa filosa]